GGGRGGAAARGGGGAGGGGGGGGEARAGRVPHPRGARARAEPPLRRRARARRRQARRSAAPPPCARPAAARVPAAFHGRADLRVRRRHGARARRQPGRPTHSHRRGHADPCARSCVGGTMNDFESLRAVWIPELVVRLPAPGARLGWPPARGRAPRRERLRALPAGAVAPSPYHRRRLRGLDPHRFELADLASLPVMTKGEMMDDLGAVFTDRELTVDQVERALAATREEPIPIAGRYVAMASGGSSGRPGVFAF